MFLQYTKYRDIDAVTWHDACHVTKSPRLSLRKRGIIARKEGEPGNEAKVDIPRYFYHCTFILRFFIVKLSV